ncbi:thioredoxin family protein [Pedobacter aquatilis]|uniref:thioredoxin family protein n=1 Tax=Pedobacter aquatilis TaxID=351343 RepID=UPI00292DD344|nr:thioredoxin fold domain-containing protein [Pedobacter aquatilis]
MKIKLILLLLLSANQIATAQGIEFVAKESFELLLNQAKEQNKFILIDCYTTWCVPCIKMDEEVYSNVLSGNLTKNKFISVKVQMDRNPRDKKPIRDWYGEAEKIANRFYVNAFPTLIILDPTGKMIGKSVGMISLKDFEQFCLNAQEPKKRFDFMYALYLKNQIPLEDYYSLADKAFELGKIDIGWEIRKKYKGEYLDKLPYEKLLTEEHLKYFDLVPELISSSDRVYRLCVIQPATIDTIIPGLSTKLINTTCLRENFQNILFDNRKSKYKVLDWKMIERRFLKKYPLSGGLKLFLESKISYYKETKDWQNFAGTVDELINRCPEYIKDKFSLYYGLNNFAWYGIFLNSNDPGLLRRAIGWQNIIIAKLPLNEMIDTKANLLYKLGKINKAIRLEKKIVNLLAAKSGKSPKEVGGIFYQTLMKMEQGLSTWE